ncbi:MAG: hypothetical protein O3A46_04520, partial [Candidatus Poribacteria bacterium]|nr:hypothetical protein [Candidatus Poribacteria bacterium]
MRRMLANRVIVTCVMAIGVLAGSTKMANAQSPDDIPRRWIYASHNLLVDENVEDLIGILERGAAVGYNGVLLADFKFSILNIMEEPYFENVERVKAVCEELGIEIVPGVFPIGYSGGILYHNPNLAAGYPVKNATFIAKDGVARITPSEPILTNGDFESYEGDTFTGWGFQDDPGNIT